MPVILKTDTIKTKQIVKPLSTLFVLSAIFGGLYFCYNYYSALKDQEKEWYKTQYVDKEFIGKIKEITDYSYNPSFSKKFIGLTILINGTTEVHYAMLNFKKQPLLKTFIKVGDSVYKKAYDKSIIFKNSSGQIKTFELPIDINE